MPLWAYNLNPVYLGILMVGGILSVSLAGLFFCRRFILPLLEFHDGVNDAASGTVQAIGVFYGVTVGLISVGVWNTWSGGADLVSREAAAIGSLYRDCDSFPEPSRSHLCQKLRAYTTSVIEADWPAQRKGELPQRGVAPLNELQQTLMTFEPKTQGQQARYTEALAAYNRLLTQRGLRIDAVSGGLSGIMWGVIWCGAAISIGVAYFFHLKDPKLHAILVTLIAGFLSIVLFMIVINDKPFYGEVCIGPDSYQLVLDTVMKTTGKP
jgi:hypothetical protein